MKKHTNKRALLVLAVLVLLTAIGAKMYSNITMGDDEWIGLGANAGRIVFDNQVVDRVYVEDAHLLVDSTYSAGNAAVTVDDTLELEKYEYGDESWAVVQGYDRVVATARPMWLGASKFYFSGGNVGIGESDPTYKLDVAGDLRATGDLYVTGEATALQFSAGGSIFAMENVIAMEDVLSIGEVRANEDIWSTGGNLVAYESVQAGTHVTATGNVYAGDDIIAGRDVVFTGDVIPCGEDAGDVYSSDVYALDNVTAGGSVFIGTAEDAEEDGARMSIRADNDDGGYVDWSIRNFEGGVYIFEDSSNAGPNMVLWVRWLTHSNTTGDYTSGETILVNGPHVQDSVTIASDGDKIDLDLSFYQDNVMLVTAGPAGHLYDVTLLMMWVED